MLGRLSDGKSARVVAVAIDIVEDGLRLTPAPATGREPEVWPFAQIRLVEIVGTDLRLGRLDDPDARLLAPEALRGPLSELAPLVLSKRKASRRTAVAVGAGIAATLALTAGVFIGIPLAAGPLAQMTPMETEAQLGKVAVAQLSPFMPPCAGGASIAAEATLTPVLRRLEREAGLSGPVTLRFVDVEEPNALALPGAQVWVTRGLLESAKAPDEIVAVLAHELAHVRNRDGLTAFYRRFGAALVLDVITGGSGIGQQVILLSGDLAELGHTRGQERRADAEALDTMQRAGYDPAALSRAFERIEADVEKKREAKGGGFKLPGWLSTHPDTEVRRRAAEARANPSAPQPMDESSWAVLKNACGGAE
jgi:beta-barrel assembly-enhancing protease